MKRVLLTILCLIPGLVNGQELREDVHLFTSNDILLTGETLLLSAQVHANGKPSKISKVLYIELVGKNGFEHRQKLWLEGGKGHGEVFLNSTLESGTYQLLAYTQWMRNYDDLTRKTITLINPFKEYDGEYAPGDSVSIPSSNPPGYLTRTIVEKNLEVPKGTYSVSVRKKLASFDRKWQGLHEQIKGQGDITNVSFPPEMRDNLIQGKLTNSSGEGVSAYVLLSTPGKDFQVRTTKSKEDGSFILPYAFSTRDQNAYIYPFELDSGYTIAVTDNFLHAEEYPALDFSIDGLDSQQVAELVDKSVRIQLDNAFPVYEVVNSKPGVFRRQMEIDYIYMLDDYTRFQTLKETFTEFIVTANIRDRREPIIRTYFGPIVRGSNSPLILLDGVHVSAKKLLDFNPYEIEKVEILNSQFYLGRLLLDGMASMTTYEANLGTFRLDQNYTNLELLGLSTKSNSWNTIPSISKEYPDQRDQLFWDLITIEGSATIQFVTSDVEGLFEIVIEGVTTEGEAIRRSEDFVVSKSDVR